jgi:hypothetical protein
VGKCGFTQYRNFAAGGEYHQHKRFGPVEASGGNRFNLPVNGQRAVMLKIPNQASSADINEEIARKSQKYIPGIESHTPRYRNA